MRSLLLATSAFFLAAGIAGAQTTPSAPGAATNAMSNTAPAAPAAAAPATPATPASPAAPAAAPAAAAGAAAATAPSAPALPKPHHHWHHHAAAAAAAGLVPIEAGPGDYLHTAAHAIKAHNAALADDALSHAETRLLNRAVPAGEVAPDDSPAITAIEQARAALRSHDFAAAAAATHQAWQAVKSSGE